MEVDGYITSQNGGYVCTGCGELIEQSDRCIRGSYAEIQTKQNGEPHVQGQSYAGVWHLGCFTEEAVGGNHD